VLIFAVSVVTKKATPEQLAGLTYGTVTKEQDSATRASFGFWEIFHTAMVLAIIAAIYIYFW
jgi:solute:Na+ symporter, SSS family